VATPDAFIVDAPRFTATGTKIDGTALADQQVETWVGDELTEMLFVGGGGGYTVYARRFSTVERAESGAGGSTLRVHASVQSSFASSVTDLDATLDGGTAGTGSAECQKTGGI
jgi:hypothetical protein